ncbi:MAG TPA: hypothetical protein V6C72_19320 [Chroococcales cyanobacterium]
MTSQEALAELMPFFESPHYKHILILGGRAFGVEVLLDQVKDAEALIEQAPTQPAPVHQTILEKTDQIIRQ